MLSQIAARFADIARLLIGVAHNYVRSNHMGRYRGREARLYCDASSLGTWVVGVCPSGIWEFGRTRSARRRMYLNMSRTTSHLPPHRLAGPPPRRRRGRKPLRPP